MIMIVYINIPILPMAFLTFVEAKVVAPPIVPVNTSFPNHKGVSFWERLTKLAMMTHYDAILDPVMMTQYNAILLKVIQ